MLRKILGIGAIALLFGFVPSGPASAASTTIAQFFQEGGGNDFVFTDTGNSSGGFTLTSNAVPVLFMYETANGTGAFAPIAATMSFSAQVDGTATTSGGTVTQNLQNVDITFTANTAINGMTNLLTVSDSGVSGVTGTLNGTTGTQSPTASGATSVGNTVTFSSDFLSFSGATDENYSLAFSSLIDQATSQSGLTVGSDGYVNSFTAAGDGTFASNPAPTVPEATPEPGSISLAVALGAGGFFGMLKRRRS